MKLTRKLIPAFAMLLVSAVLMSTASFAWFSMNGDVKATGMSVTATAPAALWIAAAADGPFLTEIDLDSATEAISPVTDYFTETANKAGPAAEWKFDILKDDVYKNVDSAGKVSGATITSASVENDTKGNFLHETFYLRLEGANDGTTADMKEILANVSLASKNGSADKIYKCINVAIATDDKEGGLSEGGSVIYTGFADLGDAGKITGTVPFLTIAAQETIAVEVYIWFEGEDTNCTNNNSQSLDEYTITLDFTARTPAAAG